MPRDVTSFLPTATTSFGRASALATRSQNLAVAGFLSDQAGSTRSTGINNAQILGGVGGAYQNQQQQMLDAPWAQTNKLNSIFSGQPMRS